MASQAPSHGAAHGDARPCVEASRGLHSTDAAQTLGELLRSHDTKSEATVIGRVPRHVGEGRQHQRAEALAPGPRRRRVQQHPPQPLSSMGRVYRDLLDVAATVHHLCGQVADRSVLIVRGHPRPSISLEDRQLLNRQGLILGHGLHANISERHPGCPFHLPQHRKVLSPGQSITALTTARPRSRGWHRACPPGYLATSGRSFPSPTSSTKRSSEWPLAAPFAMLTAPATVPALP